jgi:DNA-binding SARP family transcriptional activator/Flp pilus assembly protein TadD
MEAGVVEGMESTRRKQADDLPGLRIQMLGPLTITRQGTQLALPASRKVRALTAYLALAPRPVSRSHLCELLWDEPSDPRGELRWSLSKMRSVLDEPGRQRVATSGDLISLDLADCFVDALAIAKAAQSGIEKLDLQALRSLAGFLAGAFLDGLEMENSPHFNGWLVAQRRRLHACHTAILEQLVRSLPADSEEMLGFLDQWLAHAALDRRAHEILLRTLARRGRIREGEEHLATAVRLFEAEGLDAAPLRAAWRDARQQAANVSAGPQANPARATAPATAARRASIAVMPLIDRMPRDAQRGGIADGLTHDIITRLAKLRSFAVIAQGTMFALGERSIGPEDAARTLNTDYVASGSVERRAERLRVRMELVETRMARIVWAEDFDYRMGDALQVLDEIGNRIVAAIASEIETAERNRALLKPPNSLDAWEAYHRGLWHMYRFRGGDNDQAQHFFQMAVRLDPTFARAHAGLSFTHWQNAFLHRTADRELEVNRAMASAEQSVIVDERDPTAHWAMGRALWLRGRQEQCLQELEQAVDLSPNFALGHYTLSFVHSQSGDPAAAIRASDHSRRLSPFDPLLFAMLASRAIAHVRLGQLDEAAVWAVNAINRPNAHIHVRAIAAHCLAAAGRVDEARSVTALIHAEHPNYRVDDYLTAFRFSPDAAALFRQSAKMIGIG